jgi:hypothetical protein
MKALRRATEAYAGQLVSTAGAVALLALMFAVKWYGIAGVTGPFASRSGISSSEDGWHALTTLRWLMLATVVVTVCAAVARASGRSADLSPAVIALGGLTAALLVYRVLIDLPHPADVEDQKVGAFLGLLSALGTAYGGYESRRAARKSAENVVQRSRIR